MSTYRELIKASVPTRAAAVLVGIPRATATRKPRSTPLPAVPVTPSNKLGPVERARILALVNSPRFVDLPPIQIYAQLLDEGVYVASISTIYRILSENRQVRERRRLARHPARKVPELIATGPGQVYSWDITKLASPIKGKYFDCYVMIDIFSRYIVGAVVHSSESAVLAAEMMKDTFGIHGTPQVVHADRGTSMTSKTVAALLSDLEVTKSHSRPRVSNDNPYSEAWFKTLKFAPVFPERFGSLADARIFMASFVDGYNHSHRHSGIGLNTPADVHYGLAASKADDRSAVLAQARLLTPERFSSARDPKILALPGPAWINRPAEELVVVEGAVKLAA
jgi:putative transposase